MSLVDTEVILLGIVAAHHPKPIGGGDLLQRAVFGCKCDDSTARAALWYMIDYGRLVLTDSFDIALPEEKP